MSGAVAGGSAIDQPLAAKPVAKPTTASVQYGEQPLRAAVIGAGRISVEHLSFLQKSPQAELCAVCDLSPALVEYARDQFQAQQAFTDHRQMLDVIAPDVVHLCTPPHTHVPLVTDALLAGAHVICEKPLAPAHKDFISLWELAREKQRLLIEDHCCRFTPKFLRMEELIRQGKIGQVREVEVRMVLPIAAPQARYGDANMRHPSHDLPAGVIHELLPHMTYLLLRFLGGFETVNAAWRRHGDNALLKWDDLDATVIAGKTHGRLRFSAHQGPDGFLVTVRGDEGWVETEFYYPYLQLMTRRRGGDKLNPFINQFVQGLSLLRASVSGLKDKVMQRGMYEGIHELLRQTYGALATGDPAPVTFNDMDQSMRLIDALLEPENRW